MALMPKKDVSTANVIDGGAHTILGPEASFDGKLVFQGQVRIDGRFAGEIETEDTVTIAKSGEVNANVKVGTLKLHGMLRGNIRASKLVELHPPARLYGDIETPQLVIHAGVIFEGNCRMENLDRPRPEILKKDAANSDKASAGDKGDGKDGDKKK